MVQVGMYFAEEFESSFPFLDVEEGDVEDVLPNDDQRPPRRLVPHEVVYKVVHELEVLPCDSLQIPQLDADVVPNVEHSLGRQSEDLHVDLIEFVVDLLVSEHEEAEVVLDMPQQTLQHKYPCLRCLCLVDEVENGHVQHIASQLGVGSGL